MLALMYFETILTESDPYGKRTSGLCNRIRNNLFKKKNSFISQIGLAIDRDICVSQCLFFCNFFLLHTLEHSWQST